MVGQIIFGIVFVVAFVVLQVIKPGKSLFTK